MKRGRPARFHCPGLLASWKEKLRGRRQKLVRAGERMPLLLLSYPKDAEAVAGELEAGYARTLLMLGEGIRGLYEQMWAALPAIVVVVLCERNVCGCLGHHHPPGTESRLARRLASELGHPVAEIDLAYGSIRSWRPEPLASLAAGAPSGQLDPLCFRAALLAV
ncbi:MAG: hypothetical protein ACPL88_08005, partial [Bryobacteraceae bacterium]